MAKLTTFIICLIVFSMFLAGAFTPLLSSINSNYDVVGYNQTRLDAYNKLNELQENVNNIEDKATSIQSRSGVVDVLGGFFEAGYDALKIGANSFSIFYTMTEQAALDSGIENAGIFKSGLILIVIVIIFLGIIVGAVVKTNL